MNKCLNCNKEIGLRAKYCSDRCRMAYNRQPEQNIHEPEQTRTDLPEQPEQNVRPEPEQTQPEHEPEQLLTQEMIDILPEGVTRPDSDQDWSWDQEYHKTISRLLTEDIKTLEQGQAFIPAWRYVYGNSPVYTVA